MSLAERYDHPSGVSFLPFDQVPQDKIPNGLALLHPAASPKGFVVVMPSTNDDELTHERFSQVGPRIDELLNRLSVAAGGAAVLAGWWHQSMRTGLNFSTDGGVLSDGVGTNAMMLEKALAFRGTEVRSMRYALNRYRASTAEVQNQADSAVNIAIAWEAMMLHGDDSKTELSFRIALRAARFIGGDLEQRRKIFDVVRRAYDTRSKVVHNGGINNDGDLYTQNMQAAELFTAAATKILSDGFPSREQWKDLILG